MRPRRGSVPDGHPPARWKSGRSPPAAAAVRGAAPFPRRPGGPRSPLATRDRRLRHSRAGGRSGRLRRRRPDADRRRAEGCRRSLARRSLPARGRDPRFSAEAGPPRRRRMGAPERSSPDRDPYGPTRGGDPDDVRDAREPAPRAGGWGRSPPLPASPSPSPQATASATPRRGWTARGAAGGSAETGVGGEAGRGGHGRDFTGRRDAPRSVVSVPAARAPRPGAEGHAPPLRRPKNPPQRTSGRPEGRPPVSP